MKLAKGMKKIAEGWIVKPKGFRVRFEQMTDGELILGYSPPKEDNPLDSDVTTWRYGWKLAMATRPGDQGLEEGCLVNVTVVNDQDDPVNYYATGKPQIFNEYEKTI
ncbi:MAG: hypothetical protein HUK40_04980 [Desulfobacter sp.]|nr:hypothetical protein [Desulfobacter sp.]WDP87409.1 MAG: hypothetical protein HUN05_21665 [Desulfobacter sp.]